MCPGRRAGPECPAMKRKGMSETFRDMGGEVYVEEEN
jgi:hypothetical protein